MSTVFRHFKNKNQIAGCSKEQILFLLSQIADMIMRSPLPVGLHQNITRLASFLPWKRQTSGIQDRKAPGLLQTRIMRVSIHDNVRFLQRSLFLQSVMPHTHTVMMAMRQQGAVFPNCDDLLFGKTAVPVIIPGYHTDRRIDKRNDILFCSLHIPQMDQPVDRTCLRQNLLKILFSSMGITDNQYLHDGSSFSLCSSSFISRNALPLWLSSFFISSGSSAEQQPYSGSQKIGS